MGFSFVGATVYDLWHLNKNKEELKEMLSLHQTITALIDIVAAVALAVLATLILTHTINCNPTIAYSLLGACAFCVINDFIAFAIQTYKKFKHNTQKLSQNAQTNLNNQKQWQQDLTTSQQQCRQKDLELADEKNKLTKEREEKANMEKSFSEQIRRIKALEYQLNRKAEQSIKSPDVEKSPDADLIEIQPIFKEGDQITIVVAEDEKCPYIDYQEKKLYISSEQQKLMEKDLYFKNFVLGTGFDGKVSAATSEGFLLNVKVFLKKTVLFQQQDPNKRIDRKRLVNDVESCLKDCKEIFEKMELTNDACFVARNFNSVNKAINTLLEALLYAFEMDNEALMMFWLKALETRFDTPTLMDAIDAFKGLPVKLQQSLHEIIFAYLAKNINAMATLGFMQKYQGQQILKIGTLHLQLIEKYHPLRLNLLNLIDWNGVKILDIDHVEAHASTEGWDLIFEKCTEAVFCHRGDSSIPRAHSATHTLAQKHMSILDFSHDNPYLEKNESYNFHALCLKKSSHSYLEHILPLGKGERFFKIQIFYKLGSEERLKDYLKTYYHIYCEVKTPSEIKN